MKSVTIQSVLTVFMAVFIVFSVATTALAATAASPCDPKYYDSLKSRAWLEAQREITQNQNLIFKPDSVMQYTCFDRFMNVLAQEASNMFSETTRWGTISGIDSTSMDKALQNLVGSALGTYIYLNFNHPALGGRDGANHVPAGISGGSYTCDQMYKVWNEAKCMDFISNQTNDGFYTFEHYSTNPDKRYLPSPCTNSTLPAKWTSEIGLATLNTSTPWTEDDVKTFFDLMDPSKCTSALKIETGITVVRKKSPSPYQEKVCVPAGCHYVPTSANAGNCQP